MPLPMQGKLLTRSLVLVRTSFVFLSTHLAESLLSDLRHQSSSLFILGAGPPVLSLGHSESPSAAPDSASTALVSASCSP